MGDTITPTPSQPDDFLVPRPPPITIPEQQKQSESEQLSESQDQPATGRSKFACTDDIIMLKQVLHVRIWEAPSGKKMLQWYEVATACKTQRQYGLDKKGPALKTRFEKLLECFKKDEMNSIRSSGVAEQFDEREQLLTDIKSRMEDWNTNTCLRKEAEKAKKEGIENSGILMRKMGMGIAHAALDRGQNTHAFAAEESKNSAENVST